MDSDDKSSRAHGDLNDDQIKNGVVMENLNGNLNGNLSGNRNGNRNGNRKGNPNGNLKGNLAE